MGKGDWGRTGVRLLTRIRKVAVQNVYRACSNEPFIRNIMEKQSNIL